MSTTTETSDTIPYVLVLGVRDGPGCEVQTGFVSSELPLDEKFQGLIFQLMNECNPCHGVGSYDEMFSHHYYDNAGGYGVHAAFQIKYVKNGKWEVYNKHEFDLSDAAKDAVYALWKEDNFIMFN